MLTVVLCLAAAVFALLAGCWYLAGVVARPRFATLERAWAQEEKHGVSRSEFDALPKTAYTIAAEDGYLLHAVHIPAAEASDRCVIITHGYGYNRVGAVKYALLFRRLGFSAVIYDNRGHGENARSHVTMGKREHRDLLAVIRDTKQRFGYGMIGLHGESMGSATTVMALGKKPEVAFAVADCGYADLTLLLRDLIGKQFRLPAWLVYPASAVCRLRFGFAFGEVRPAEALRGNTVPVLFIHGAADDFILPEHGRILQQAAPGSRLVLVEGAGHAVSVCIDPQGYEEAVADFLRDAGV